MIYGRVPKQSNTAWFLPCYPRPVSNLTTSFRRIFTRKRLCVFWQFLNSQKIRCCANICSTVRRLINEGNLHHFILSYRLNILSQMPFSQIRNLISDMAILTAFVKSNFSRNCQKTRFNSCFSIFQRLENNEFAQWLFRWQALQVLRSTWCVYFAFQKIY